VSLVDLYDCWCQLRVEQVPGVLLTLVDCPPQEGRERLGLGAVLLFLINENPCESGDRVGLRVGRVGDGHPQVLGQLRSFGSGRRGVQAGLDEVAGGVLHRRPSHVVLDGVGQFNVADRAPDLAYLPGHTLVSLPA